MSATLDPSTRKNIRLNLWDAVSELSDLHFQRETWGSIDNPHFTYVECCECFFDCLPDGVDAALGCGLISEHEGAALAPLLHAVDGYKPPNGDGYDNVAILIDPNWREVVRIAEVARRTLLSLVDENEAARLSHEKNLEPKVYQKAGEA